MISVTVACKQEHDRESIIKAVSEQADFRIASVGEDGFRVIMSARTEQPDIIIMDFNTNNIDSYALAPVIKRYSPATGLIVLYSFNERDAVYSAFRAGISGCVQREEGFANLASSVRCVFYGGLYFGGLDLNCSLDCFSLRTAGKEAIFCYDLTQTELCIFDGIIRGNTDKEIAKNLNINPGSLRNCVSNVKRRTGLKNRVQMSIYTMFAGLINPAKIREMLNLK